MKIFHPLSFQGAKIILIFNKKPIFNIFFIKKNIADSYRNRTINDPNIRIRHKADYNYLILLYLARA